MHGSVGTRQPVACTAGHIDLSLQVMSWMGPGTSTSRGAIVTNKTSARPPQERCKCAKEETHGGRHSLEPKVSQVRELLERRRQGRAALGLEIVVAASGGGGGVDGSGWVSAAYRVCVFWGPGGCVASCACVCARVCVHAREEGEAVLTSSEGDRASQLRPGACPLLHNSRNNACTIPMR
jgi:hypothetical protein